MLSHFSHSLADGDVVVKKVAVLAGVPVGEGRELLGDGVEETNNDSNRGCLHVGAELVHSDGVGDTVVAVELHLLPHGEQDGGNHEDGRPVLHLLTAVDTRVQGRELLEDVLLELTPHVGKSALDLEVDHDGSDGAAVVLGVLVVNLSVQVNLGSLVLDHGDVHGEVVGKDKLERLADDRHLLLDEEAVSSLEDLGDEGSTLEVIIDEVLEGAINVLVEVLGESIETDTLSANIELLSAGLEVNGLLVGQGRLNPVNREAAVVGDKDLANHDRESEAVTVGDPHQGLLLGEALDIVDRDTTVHVPLVIGLPVLHEVTNILDVNASAGNLPQASVRRLATSARLSLITRLLEELASQASSQLSYLAGLLSLLRQERSLSATNLLLDSTVLLAVGDATDNGLGGLGNGALARA